MSLSISFRSLFDLSLSLSHTHAQHEHTLSVWFGASRYSTVRRPRMLSENNSQLQPHGYVVYYKCSREKLAKLHALKHDFSVLFINPSFCCLLIVGDCIQGLEFQNKKKKMITEQNTRLQRCNFWTSWMLKTRCGERASALGVMYVSARADVSHCL